jgi:radical SAM protein with 4Fe4S-binding SPASM domain
MGQIESLPRKRLRHSKDGIHLYVNPYWGGKFVTNDAGVRIIELMDQENDEEKLIRLIAEELSINPYEAAARLVTFVDQLRSRRMLGDTNGQGNGLPVPNTGFLEVTRKCDTHCRLCYVNSGQDEPDTLSKEELRGVIDQMADMGITFIALTGGDPLTRTDLPEILAHISVNHDCKAGISTSLLSLDDETARQMKDLDVAVQVSLDGSTPELNDWNRGKGSFDRAMQGIQLLQKYDIPFRFAYVIYKHNLDDIQDMIALAIDLGAKEVAFAKAKVAGRATEHRASIVPSSEEMILAYHTLYRSDILTRETGIKIRCKYNQGLVAGLDDRVGCLPCGAGRTFVHVAFNGDIIPCSLLNGVDAYRIGNVRNDKLADVWQDSSVYGSFRDTTADQIQVCGRCKAKYLCGGGCRADAYLTHGDFYASCGDCEDLLAYYDWILDRGCKEQNVTVF